MTEDNKEDELTRNEYKTSNSIYKLFTVLKSVDYRFTDDELGRIFLSYVHSIRSDAFLSRYPREMIHKNAANEIRKRFIKDLRRKFNRLYLHMALLRKSKEDAINTEIGSIVPKEINEDRNSIEGVVSSIEKNCKDIKGAYSDIAKKVEEASKEYVRELRGKNMINEYHRLSSEYNHILDALKELV